MSYTNREVAQGVNWGFELSNSSGSFWAASGSPRWTGRLPTKILFAIDALQDLGYPVNFVVYSYGTPIAFKILGEWIIPDVYYSATTAKQKSNLSLPGAKIIPADISLEELTRVVLGLMEYVPKGRNELRTKPGRKYVEGE